jgi:hypothetical protein
MHRCALFAVAVGLWALAAAPPAAAQTRLVLPCDISSLPCSVSLSAHVDAVGGSRLPWVVRVSVPAGVCLELRRESSAGVPLRTAIAPNGRVFRSGEQPLQVNPTIAGWYTVQFDSMPPTGEQVLDLEIGLLAQFDCDSPTVSR